MDAGNNITTGNKNIMIGRAVQAPSATGSNQLNIGNHLKSFEMGKGGFEVVRKDWANSTTVEYGSHLTRVRWRTQANSVWRTICSINDFYGRIFVTASDAASGDRGEWSIRTTSPAYGVANMSQIFYHDGGWNTGSFAMRFTNISGTYYLQGFAQSYYSSSNQFYFDIEFNRA
jgi:hypothetical protein